MKSRSVSTWLGRVLKSTTLASIHKTARRRVGGHSAHCGRKSHSLGIYVGIVLGMRAGFCVVRCQFSGPSPHSMRQCCIVSCMPQLLHLSVGDILILWRRTFVGRMLCITLYHTAFVPPGKGVEWIFYHTVYQSVFGHSLVMRISCIPVSPLLIWYKVLYALLLWAHLDSIGPSSTYAESIAKRRRYSKFSGMTSRNGGLAPFTFRPHVRI
jgi:hypothetical protein